MIDKINSLLKRVEEFRPKAEAEIEEFRVRMLGRKGDTKSMVFSVRMKKRQNIWFSQSSESDGSVSLLRQLPLRVGLSPSV